jgi:quinol monooxygenase YgiN
MPKLKLNGQMVCQTPEQREAVMKHLDEHVKLTRSESGCLEFSIEETKDPLVFQVNEMFASEGDFQAHRARTESTEWAEATKGIKRKYNISMVKVGR